jgi:hypothetical protein
LEQQKRAQELAQLQKDIEEEEKKLEQLNRWLENWDRAERLRRFIAVYAEKSQSWPAEKQSNSREWIDWAFLVAAPITTATASPWIVRATLTSPATPVQATFRP